MTDKEDPKIGRMFAVTCGSKYFEMKYGDSPIIKVESDSGMEYNPPTFLYQGRVLAEGRKELLTGKIYYGHVYSVRGHGLGELVHESELGEEVNDR